MLKVNRRDAQIALLTLMYNLSNIALYIESPNEFGEHYGLIDHRLSDWDQDDSLQKALFLGILFCSFVFLGVSNQKSYHKHISKLPPEKFPILMKFFPEQLDDNYLQSYPLLQEPESSTPPPSKVFVFISFMGALYKTTTSSASLAALVKPWNETAGISLGVITGLGNFVAQFAIFAEPFVKKYNIHISNHYYCRTILSHTLTLLYNLPNAALYFNVGDEFLHHINVIDHRLSVGIAGWEYFLFGSLIVSSVFLLISTQRSYASKIANVFTDSEKEPPETTYNEYSQLEKIKDKLTPFINFEACYTSAYKAAINYISLLATMYSFTNTRWAGFLVATLCAPGNLTAMFSILKPELSKKQQLECTFFSTHLPKVHENHLNLENIEILSI